MKKRFKQFIHWLHFKKRKRMAEELEARRIAKEEKEQEIERKAVKAEQKEADDLTKVLCEYNLIMEKKSKLSRMKRDKVVAHVKLLIKKGKIKFEEMTPKDKVLD